MVKNTCSACAAHYGDDGICDEGKPVASPHRLNAAATRERQNLFEILRSIRDGGVVSLAALEAWPHEKLIEQGYATCAFSRKVVGRYALTRKAVELLTGVQRFATAKEGV